MGPQLEVDVHCCRGKPHPEYGAIHLLPKRQDLLEVRDASAFQQVAVQAILRFKHRHVKAQSQYLGPVVSVVLQ